MNTTALFPLILLITLSTLLSFNTANGYIIGRRLLSLQDSPATPGDYLLVNRRSNPDTDTDTSSTTDRGYTKKSQYMGYRSLKKFGGSGSRNCFFTPVQCVLEKEMSKYKKLVDNNVHIGAISRK